MTRNILYFWFCFNLLACGTVAIASDDCAKANSATISQSTSEMAKGTILMGDGSIIIGENMTVTKRAILIHQRDSRDTVKKKCEILEEASAAPASEPIKPAVIEPSKPSRVLRLVQGNPKTTAALGATVAGVTFLYAYKKDKKFRSRIHETSEHYYYKMLEKLMPISFKWSDLEDQPLTQKDVLIGLGLIGTMRGLGALNAQYQLQAKISELYGQAKQLGSTGYGKVCEKLGGERTLLFYGVSGILLAASGRYLYSMFSRQPIYYKELLHSFMHSLDQEQINAIGLEALFQAESDPSVLEHESVQNFLNSKQKSRVARLMREYHKYLEKLAQA